MIPHRLLAAAVAGAMAVAPGSGGQRPTFRSTTDSVSIDVAVRQGLNPVAGLTSADFILEDNGARQAVDSAAIDALPVDVTLALDVSGSVASEIDRFKSNVRAIAAVLRPTDRVRVVTFGSRVRQVVPMQPAGGVLALDDLVAEKSTSLNDGLFFALAWPSEPERRHLVVAFTDGYDTASAIDNDLTVTIASHADAVLHVVMAPATGSTTGFEGSKIALEQAAERTGGRVHKLGDAVKAFKEVFDEFRTSYVLRYTLAGVRREGWHDVTVTVNRTGAFTIRARKGYFGG